MPYKTHAVFPFLLRAYFVLFRPVSSELNNNSYRNSSKRKNYVASKVFRSEVSEAIK